MTDIGPRTAPLREWNRLAQENAENAIVSSMFEAGFVANEPIDTFSTWLLLGTGAIGGFMISNVEKVLPLLTSKGFAVCGVLLLISCVLGVIAKGFALRVKIMREILLKIQQTFQQHLTAYQNEEEEIHKGAEYWGITLQSGIRMNRVLEEFYKPLPSWVHWLAERQLRRHAGNPQIAYIPAVKLVTYQGVLAALQTFTFLTFLGTAFFFAAATAA